MGILYRMKFREREAAAREIESWKVNHDQAMLARDVEDMIQESLSDWERDEQLFRLVLKRAAGDDKGRIDEANKFIQNHCDTSLRIHDFIRECIGMVAGLGHQVENAIELDRATESYRRWKEDAPDLLAMTHGPTQKVVQERVAAALRDQSQESDWEELFTEEIGD